MSESTADGGGEHDPVEIEWQFDALDLRPVERWLATLPTLAIETGDGGTITALARPPRRLVDSYRDSDDWRIARAGFVVRTRRRGRHDEITLKDTRPAQSSGLRQRLEVTEVLPPSGLDALGTDGPVGRRLRAIVGSRRLREVLQVRTRRRPFALRVGGVDVAEVALDDTMIVVGTGQRPMQLRRVEVEVQPDWLEALEPIVEQLRTTCGLQPARLSKFEAGLLALGEEIPGTPDLGPTEVSPTSTMGDLAFAVLRRQLAVLQATEPGTRLGEDPEDLHDMRVATRRLRAALSLFEGVLPVRAQVFREELGWLARLLGAVRDLDVQLEGLAGMSRRAADGALGPSPGGRDPLAELAALLERERETARADMLSGLDSVRWDRLAKGLAAMAQQGPARRSLATRVPAAIGLPDLVLTRHKEVVKAAKRAKRSGIVTDFHALRIRCKRLRYALEFSGDVYGTRTSRFVRALTVLQGELGGLQDAEVASLQLAALATGDTRLPAATVFVMGGVAERHRREVNRLLESLPDELPRTGGRAWRELRDLMERRRVEAEAARPPVRTTLHALPRPRPDEEPATPPPAARADQPIHPAGMPGLTALGPPQLEPPPQPAQPARPAQPAQPDRSNQSSQGE
ncbi:MAG TPA: CHAD domain-containing protein [Acidimicrobiales bacterium]|jgi:CHAD domain-containing protein|nr:CHAD domain-containing protein [Acidimicrobiales bacterium]